MVDADCNISLRIPERSLLPVDALVAPLVATTLTGREGRPVQSGPLDLVPDLPKPDRQMGHRSTGVSAATLGYGHGYRLPPLVDRLVDRRLS
jgi:hypothetical protein